MATPAKGQREKNRAAVYLGRLGGLKGGKARAIKLTPEERQIIAKNAATTRWNRLRTIRSEEERLRLLEADLRKQREILEKQKEALDLLKPLFKK